MNVTYFDNLPCEIQMIIRHFLKSDINFLTCLVFRHIDKYLTFQYASLFRLDYNNIFSIVENIETLYNLLSMSNLQFSPKSIEYILNCQHKIKYICQVRYCNKYHYYSLCERFETSVREITECHRDNEKSFARIHRRHWKKVYELIFRIIIYDAGVSDAKFL